MVHDSSERVHKRCRRYNLSGHAHGLTFSCFHRQQFLTNNWICRCLAESITGSREKHKFLIWGYVFMPEHVHLLIKPTMPEYSISRILQSIKQPVARRAIFHLGQSGSSDLKQMFVGEGGHIKRFWQAGGGFDRNLTDRNSILNGIRYIHYNPVRRGLVQRGEKWYWSSAADWNGRQDGPIPVDVGTLDT